MTRDELAHIVRAAHQVTGDPHLVVLGSQALLGSFPEAWLPSAVSSGSRADLAFVDDSSARRSTAIDTGLGGSSYFQERFRVHARCTPLDPATLPVGWRERAVPYRFGEVGGSAAVCLEPHDVVLSQMLTCRERAHELAAALLDAFLIVWQTLLGRVDELPVDQMQRDDVAASIRRLPPVAQHLTAAHQLADA